MPGKRDMPPQVLGDLRHTLRRFLSYLGHARWQPRRAGLRTGGKPERTIKPVVDAVGAGD